MMIVVFSFLNIPLSIWLLLLFPYFSYSISLSTPTEFSGLYTPSLKYNLEVYSGAWLQSKELLLQNLDAIKEISSLESTTTGGLMKYNHHKTRFILMSRDFFDYSVEHLSSSTNMVGDEGHIVTYLKLLTQKKAMWLKKIALNIPNTPEHKPFMNQTIAIIPFSTNAASSRSEIMTETQLLRLYFFESTFWSIYRYYPHIAICVASQHDYDAILQLQLPLFDLFRFHKDGNIVAWELPRFALITAHEAFSSNPRWQPFQYLYFSEGDQVLHMRHQTDLMKFFTATKGRFALVPHRLQTMILPKSLPTDLQKYISPQWRFTVTEHAQLHLENSSVLVGSCCDDGRWKFADCGNWWYHCPKWGLANMSSWLRIGKTGFTMPTATEHLGRCKYSSTRLVCPKPSSCTHRIPHELSDVCDEMPILN